MVWALVWASVWALAPRADAAAARSALDPAASVVTFDFTVNGAPRSGRFATVSGAGVFDPDDPAAARMELSIDVASLDLGDPLETGFALSAEWFDAAAHPTARYRLARLTPLPGDGAFEALGDLTIRDALEVLRTPVTLAFDGPVARASGEVAFDRRDFGVGVGPSSLFVAIGAATSVRFEIVARRID